MEKCNPVEMRKNLLIVQRYSKLGLDFVVIPAKSHEHKTELLVQANTALDEIATEAELREKNNERS